MTQPLVAVFPGQGAQKQGMAEDFHQEFPLARQVFQEAGEALSLDIAALCFTDDARLGLTEYTQPAILTTEIAMFRVMEAEMGFRPTHFGGHSLGEYTALVAAGALGLADAARTVRERGRRMQAAVPAGEGAMAAIIQPELDHDAVAACLDGLVADPANENSPDQLVISGAVADIDVAVARLSAHPAFKGARIRKLDVSAPFHCRLMAPIEPGFRELLASLPWLAPRAATVVSNYTGTFHTGEPLHLVDALTRQISGAVRWLDDMRALALLHPSAIVEIGPGRPLRGFFRGVDLTVAAATNLVSARRATAG